MKNVSVRASSLPLIMACPAAKIPPKIAVKNSDDMAARVGNAVHEVLAQCVNECLDKVSDASNFSEIIKKWGVNEEEEKVQILAATALKWWREQLRDHVEVIAVEKEMRLEIAMMNLTGHADLICRYLSDRTMIVIDWKSGFVDWGYADQILAYAYLVQKTFTDAVLNETFKGVTVWPRLNEVKVIEITDEDLKQFEERLIAAVESNECRPGPNQCHWCPRKHECEAGQQFMRSATTAIIQSQENGETVTAGKLATLYPQAQLLKSALKAFDEQLKAAVTANGPLPIGDGRVLDFRVETRDTILLNAQSFALLDQLSRTNDEDADIFNALEGALTVKKKAIQDLAASMVKTGKGKAREAVMEQLFQADAVKTTTIRKIITRKE